MQTPDASAMHGVLLRGLREHPNQVRAPKSKEDRKPPPPVEAPTGEESQGRAEGNRVRLKARCLHFGCPNEKGKCSEHDGATEKGSLPKERPWYKRHEDDEYVDEVKIAVIPRWKSSYLSGDEWRVSAALQFFRKGHLVYQRGFHDIETAAAALGWFERVAGEGEDYKRVPEEIERTFCMQPGCKNAATVEYRMKKEYSREGMERVPYGEQRRRFCDEHKTRGDCGLEDSDSNYELVEGK